MDKPWDGMLRGLIRANPQVFVDLVLPGAQYIALLPNKLKSWPLEVDSAIQVEIKGRKVIVNLEIQAYSDVDMGNRLMRYNMVLHYDNKCPVVSRVMYLLTGSGGATSPWYRNAPGCEDEEEDVFRFCFKDLELPKLYVGDIVRYNEPILYPLVPLTRDGANRATVEWMLTMLEARYERDIAQAGYTLAALIFSRNRQLEDLEWLERRYVHMRDIVFETPFYQWVRRDILQEVKQELLKEGREEGRQEGREEGRQEGREEGRQEGREEGRQEGGAVALQQTMLEIVQKRFPFLLPLAEKGMKATCDLTLLRNSVVAVSMAADSEEARQVLLHIPHDQA